MICKEFNCLIDSYLKGKLPEAEQEAFEFHYFGCDPCFTALKIRQHLPQGIGHMESPLPLVMPLWRRWQTLSALAALFIVVILGIWFISGHGDEKTRYNLTAVPAPLYMTAETRGETTTTSAQFFSQAMAFYQQKNYRQALTHLQAIGTTTNTQVIFFRGICLLYTDQWETAINDFDQILKQQNTSYQDETLYYKAIALIRLNKIADARVVLETLMTLFSPYAAKAKDLRNKLN